MTHTILIVEDNELNMVLFNDLLDSQGYNAVQAVDGAQALEMTRRHVPDLILMDIQLPDTSGLEVTRMIKADDNLKHIPIIAVSAFAMKDVEAKINEVGCVGFVSKPISVRPFLEVVAKFLT